MAFEPRIAGVFHPRKQSRRIQHDGRGADGADRPASPMDFSHELKLKRKDLINIIHYIEKEIVNQEIIVIIFIQTLFQIKLNFSILLIGD